MIGLEGEALTIDLTRSAAVQEQARTVPVPNHSEPAFLRAPARMRLFTFLVRGRDGSIGITMKALSPLADFSYDFHDLHFERVR